MFSKRLRNNRASDCILDCVIVFLSSTSNNDTVSAGLCAPHFAVEVWLLSDARSDDALRELGGYEHTIFWRPPGQRGALAIRSRRRAGCHSIVFSGTHCSADLICGPENEAVNYVDWTYTAVDVLRHRHSPSARVRSRVLLHHNASCRSAAGLAIESVA